MPMKRCVAGLAAIALVAANGLARGESSEDKAAAERLFNDAKSLMERRDYDGACPKFAESLKLDPGIGVMLYLADCYEKQGKSASAWATFREAKDLAAKQGDSRAEVAQRHAAMLEPTLSTLTVTVSAEVPGLVVTRNGVPVGKAQWGLAVPVDPGPHVVAATAPGRRPWEATTHVPGDRAHAVVTLPALEAATTDSNPNKDPINPPLVRDVPPSSGLGTQKLVGISVGGAGVVGLGVGAIFGLIASSKLSDSNADGHCLPNNHCDAIGGQARNDAKSAATVSTVAFIVGAAAVAGGVVIYLTAPKAQAARVGVSGFVTGREGGVFLRGSF